MTFNNAIVLPLDLGTGSLRVAVKDCIDIAGYRTSGGSRALGDAPEASVDADVVARMRAADCRIMGKANMHELAYGVTGVNQWTGTPLNPLFPDHVPGGSSSGSASIVAAGSVDFAIGSDTGGSIRTPSACCGVFGFKPSFGRVSRVGAYPAQSSLDVLGPMAGGMAMIERAMEIIAPDYRPVPDFMPHLGVVRLDDVDVDQRVLAAFARALDEAGGADGEVVLPSLAEAFDANIAVIANETFAAFGHLLGSDGIGPDVRARLEAAGKVSQEKLAWAEAVRTSFRAEVDAALADSDVLVLPTMPCFPLRLDALGDAAAALRMTGLVRQFNLSGHPALTIPARAENGLPVGVQLVGRMGEDERVCAAGRIVARKMQVISIAGVRH